jgi:hypothetical protein
VRPRLLAVIAAAASAICLPSGAVAAPIAQEPPATANFNGTDYTWSQVAKLQLSCVISGGRATCFATQVEADRVATLQVNPFAAPPLTAAATCTPALTVWAGPNSTGFSASYTDYPGWNNLPVGLKNDVSSWRPGCRPGRLSDLDNGGGPQITLGSGSPTQSPMPSGWENRANSAYRG